MAENVAQTATRKPRRTMEGVVTAAKKTPKTITVQVEYLSRHEKYGKFLRRTGKLRAHDEKQEAHAGDRVEVMECRPMSRTKKWRLVRVLQSAPQE